MRESELWPFPNRKAEEELHPPNPKRLKNPTGQWRGRGFKYGQKQKRIGRNSFFATTYKRRKFSFNAIRSFPKHEEITPLKGPPSINAWRIVLPRKCAVASRQFGVGATPIACLKREGPTPPLPPFKQGRDKCLNDILKRCSIDTRRAVARKLNAHAIFVIKSWRGLSFLNNHRPCKLTICASENKVVKAEYLHTRNGKSFSRDLFLSLKKNLKWIKKKQEYLMHQMRAFITEIYCNYVQQLINL